jgi:hypothetical protein
LVNNTFGQPEYLSDLIGSVLMDQNDALTQPQWVEIRVPVIIDVEYTFAPGSELVFSTIDAKLIVNDPLTPLSDLKFTIKGTHLHGCNNPWDGIKVNSGGRLIFEQNCIEDAYYAISLYNGAKFSIYQNSFKENYVSIFGGNVASNTLVQLLPVEKGISDNVFSGLEELIVPLDNQTRPNTAIQLQSVLELTIGTLGTNYIHDFSNSTIGTGLSVAAGIRIFNSNITIQNTRFENIGLNTITPGGIAISAFNSMGQRRLKITGLGKTNPVATFKNCESSVEAKNGTTLNINECFFDRNIIPIRVIPVTFQHRVLIYQNRFKSYPLILYV